VTAIPLVPYQESLDPDSTHIECWENTHMASKLSFWHQYYIWKIGPFNLNVETNVNSFESIWLDQV
jgi:hypothetical protein